MFGENLTVAGVDVSGARIGERWRIGSVELEVAQPRLPCAKLGARFGDPRMVKRFAHAGRPGAYFRIVAPGELGAGDAIEILERPGARRHGRARLARDPARRHAARARRGGAGPPGRARGLDAGARG